MERRAWQRGGADCAQVLPKPSSIPMLLFLEINPLVESTDGKIVGARCQADPSMTMRSFASLRSAACYDPTQISTNEVAAKEYDLAYIALDGDIGCMVNGAGLAMATMDIIQYYGGKPANFLDVGGGASKEKVAEGFKIILSRSQSEGDPGQYFWRDHELRNACGRDHRRRQERNSIEFLSSCGWKGRMSKRDKMLQESNSTIITADGFERGGRKESEAA